MATLPEDDYDEVEEFIAEMDRRVAEGMAHSTDWETLKKTL